MTPDQIREAFERDVSAYFEALPEMLAAGYEGRYALIMDGHPYVVYETYEAALARGYQERGLQGFIVQKIEPAQPRPLQWAADRGAAALSAVPALPERGAPEAPTEGVKRIGPDDTEFLRAAAAALAASPEPAQPCAPVALKGRYAIIEAWNDLPWAVRVLPKMQTLFQAISDCEDAPGEPTLIDLVRELREALSMFAGAMPISPAQAWREAIDRVKSAPTPVEQEPVGCIVKRRQPSGLTVDKPELYERFKALPAHTLLYASPMKAAPPEPQAALREALTGMVALVNLRMVGEPLPHDKAIIDKAVSAIAASAGAAGESSGISARKEPTP